MDNLYLTAGAAWLIPGAGHFLLGAYLRGAIILIVVAALLITGVWCGGLYYPGSYGETGMIYILHQIAGLGDGIFLLLNLLVKQELNTAAALAAYRSSFFEYGGRFLALAGLLNFLAILDAVDLQLKRKS